uniref:type II toxin-antitoxin system VapC family toxin n=1 Tax=Ningiella ruwaisensis TaxID=2364274 RepID=UPI0010A07FD7|nr:PIN domain nuclease [Ningiella ruwaisensis]
MIIADTSVWVDYLNGTMNTQTDLLDQCLLDGTVAMGDLILLEILQGIKDDKQFETVKSKLSLLEQHSMLNHGLALKSAQNYRKLRKKGITIRKTNDVIIASFCIQQHISLLFTDRDFMPFVKHLKLKPVLF